MIKPTSKTINLISLIVSLIVFFIINSANNLYSKFNLEVSFNPAEVQETYVENDVVNVNNDNTEKDEEETNEYNAEWCVKIPEINLIAEINEGTTKAVMDEYVGHFEDTEIEYGNVGLAAHNRGYPVNYFQDLKKLKIGSEIIYKHKDFEMTYVVDTIEIIENTNWEYLEKTEDNRITLITCVENEPKYRRCIQGIEKIEREEF